MPFAKAYEYERYGSGILRYSEVNNDLDATAHLTYTKKGPNSLGIANDRRVPIRQRILHPSMLSVVDLAANSSSDPG